MGSHILPLQSGATALTSASEHGYCHIVKDLLRAGADPNIQNEVCFTWKWVLKDRKGGMHITRDLCMSHQGLGWDKHFLLWLLKCRTACSAFCLVYNVFRNNDISICLHAKIPDLICDVYRLLKLTTISSIAEVTTLHFCVDPFSRL